VNWFLFWLFLHITAAIAAFGPTFVFPIIGSQLEKHPASAHFAAELMHKMETRLIIPVALTMLVSGVGLIFAVGINLTKTPWLGIAIILYLIAIGIAIFNQLPTTNKLVEATAGGPPPGAPPGPPPPHVAALITRARVGGQVLTVLLVAIIFLMVAKPGGVH
jgi:Predicted integral membrane protein (DUF2269)